MTRKVGHVEVDPDRVREVFWDVAAWAEWMPGVERVRVLERAGDRSVVALAQRYQGRKFSQEIECRFTEDGLRQRQRAGFFRKWESNWRFLSPPDGSGTTLVCDLDVAIGGVTGLFLGGRAIDQSMTRLFREMLAALEVRAGAVAAKGRGDAGQPSADVLLRVFETPAGLEVWLGGRRCHMRSAQPAGSPGAVTG